MGPYIWFCYSIVGGIGVPISIDKDTRKKTYGHFARIFVNIDWSEDIEEQILIEMGLLCVLC